MFVYIWLLALLSIMTHYFDSYIAAAFGILYFKSNPAAML